MQRMWDVRFDSDVSADFSLSINPGGQHPDAMTPDEPEFVYGLKAASSAVHQISTDREDAGCYKWK